MTLRYHFRVILAVAITFCISISAVVSKSFRGKPANLGFPMNTTGDDFSPSISGNGMIMVFNSKAPKDNSHSIFISYFKSGRWTRPMVIREISSSYNDESPFISFDGETIIFASDRPGSIRPAPTSTGNKRITYDLYISHRKGSTWTKPVPVPGTVNTIYNERSPALSADNSTLYFIRWPYRYPKGARVMTAQFYNGQFEQVKELPTPINRDSYEVSFAPSYRYSGFYLSSRRTGGMGGWDLYFIPTRRGVFGRPINLGRSINTSANELFAAEAGGKLYFASDRFGSLGKYDLYSVDIPNNINRFRGIPNKRPALSRFTKDLYAKKNNDQTIKKAIVVEGRSISVTLFNKQTGAPIVGSIGFGLIYGSSPADLPETSFTRTVDAAGAITFTFSRKVKWIRVGVSQRGYKPLVQTIKVSSKDNSTLSLGIEPLEEGRRVRPKYTPVRKARIEKKEPVYTNSPWGSPRNGPTVTPPFTIKTIYFRRDSAYVKNKYRSMLNQAASFMKSRRDISVRVVGHTSLEDKGETREVSRQRAYNVARMLVKMGIDRSRIIVLVIGDRYPLIKNTSAYANRINRRVRIRFIK